MTNLQGPLWMKYANRSVKEFWKYYLKYDLDEDKISQERVVSEPCGCYICRHQRWLFTGIGDEPKLSDYRETKL